MQSDHRFDIAGKQIVNHVRVLLQSLIVPLTFLRFDSTPFNRKPVMANAQCFNEIERAVLAYTDCLALNNGLVSDELFQTISNSLSDEEILELTYIVATYGMHGIISRALRLEFDSDESQPLKEVDGDHQSLSQDHTEKRMKEILDEEKPGG